MSHILRNVWLGSIQEARNEGWLKSRGITHIVNCAKEIPNYFPHSFDYLRLDMNDVTNQPLGGNVEKACEYITDVVDGGGIVFVHCYAGISRSVSVVCYTMMKVNGSSLEESLKHIRKHRPIANPNAGFIKQLKRYQ